MKTLAKLEDVAQQALKGVMAGFEVGEKGEIICCPWLKWYQKKHGEDFLGEKWDGVLIMQDWGNESQALQSAINDIQSGKNDDRTLKNLRESKWQSAIWGDNPKWIITNAVWGLRNNPNQAGKSDQAGKCKCGYLGDLIHARAFPVWANVLAQANEKNPKLKVVFAGSWAWFDDESKNDSILKRFLTNWEEWSVKKNASLKKSDLEFIKGINESATAHFCSHPSVWKKQNCWDGPSYFCQF